MNRQSRDSFTVRLQCSDPHEVGVKSVGQMLDQGTEEGLTGLAGYGFCILDYDMFERAIRFTRGTWRSGGSGL